MSPLLSFLADNTKADRLSAEEFSLLLADARACGVLGRVAHHLLSRPQTSSLAPNLTDQLLAATTQSRGFRQDIWRELAHIERALAHLKTPVILLKGASYVHSELPPAEGRTFSDIDILVSRDQIAQAEAALMLGGWATGSLNSYDQRYYRQWAHEIPPMTHLQRGTTIDLHHSLVMPTCRIKVDSSKMVSAAITAAGSQFWHRLQDEDMVLHAVSHLMLNSEFDRGLRDLWDIHLLYQHFGSLVEDFPKRLFARAQAVGLQTLLVQVLVLTSKCFSTPLPDFAVAADNTMFLRMMARAASARHPDTKPWGQGAADFGLMLREMYLRLPPQLLAVHIWHKMSGMVGAPEKKAL